jgi:mxaJ protein
MSRQRTLLSLVVALAWAGALVATAWVLSTRAAGAATPAAPAAPLRVCADPNNLPFSNAAGEGFENRLAELIAAELGTRVEYTWWAQRRGFVRNTLDKGLCDVVMGVPAGAGAVLTTRPYYGSGYVFVYRGGGAALTSLDDPRLARLRIGVPLLGLGSAPPAMSLARRGIVQNVVGYSIFGDYREPNPPARLIDAVARDEVDVAVAWGPLAGYFARRASPPLTVTPLPAVDGGLPLRFSIALGVRKGDTALRSRLDAALAHLQPQVRALLGRYDVPLLEP